MRLSCHIGMLNDIRQHSSYASLRLPKINMTRLFFTVGLMCFNAHPVTAQDLSALYEKAHSAIVSIEVISSSVEEGRYGSGFFISKDGVIVTNYHVIQDARSIVVKSTRGDAWTSVFIGPYNEQRDLAMLKVPVNITSYLPVPQKPTFKIGQRVVVIGNPKGLESALSDGIISGLRKISDEFGEVIQTTAPISPGSSGGPLLTLKGEAIGVTTFQVISGQNLNFAVPLASFVSELPNARWLSIPQWRKELVRPEVDRTLARAISEATSGHKELAKSLLRDVLRLDESNQDALLALARICVEEWDNLQALRLLKTYLNIDSTNAEAYEMQGIVLDKVGRPDQALQAYERALALDDRLPKARYEIIVLLALRGEVSEARLHLDRLRLIDQQLYERARAPFG